jgi:hypothetical protein
MPDTLRSSWLTVLILSLCGLTAAQVQPQNKSLVINGQTGDASVIQVNGRSYVDLEALARIGNGSLGFRGNQIILNLSPGSAAAPATPAPQPEPTGPTGLTRDFRMAGIDTIAQMREWGTALATAIQGGFPVTDQWVAGYRDQAAHSLSQATTAASTSADRQALQLLTSEFESVKKWSDKLVDARKSMSAGNYALNPDALRNEPLSQKIIACGHFLAPMLAGGDFRDDPSCH